MELLSNIEEIWNRFFYPVFDFSIAVLFFYIFFCDSHTTTIEHGGMLYIKKLIRGNVSGSGSVKKENTKQALFIPIPFLTRLLTILKKRSLAGIMSLLIICFSFYKLSPILAGFFPVRECKFPLDGQLRNIVLLLSGPSFVARIWSFHPNYSFPVLCDKIMLIGSDSARYKVLEGRYIFLLNICNTLQTCWMICSLYFAFSCLKRKATKIKHSIKVLFVSFLVIVLLFPLMMKLGSQAVMVSLFYTYDATIENGISVTSEINYDRIYELIESDLLKSGLFDDENLNQEGDDTDEQIDFESLLNKLFLWFLIE